MIDSLVNIVRVHKLVIINSIQLQIKAEQSVQQLFLGFCVIYIIVFSKLFNYQKICGRKVGKFFVTGKFKTTSLLF
jgi:hypothetical protein